MAWARKYLEVRYGRKGVDRDIAQRRAAQRLYSAQDVPCGASYAFVSFVVQHLFAFLISLANFDQTIFTSDIILLFDY